MTEEEIDALTVGSVFFYGKNRRLRIVRKVNRPPKRSPYGDERVYSVICAKRRCSQYPQAYTFVDRSFLRLNCEVAGARMRLDHPMDKAMERDIEQRDTRKYELTCDIALEFPA